MTMHTKVSGTWKQINGVYVKVGGAWKTVNKVSVKVGGVWKDVFTGGAPAIPAGLIIGYDGTSAPSGWTLFTSAIGKYLVGAGSSYSVGGTGGSDSSNGTTAWGGGCQDPYYYGNPYPSSYGYDWYGGHTHTYSFTSNPLRRKFVLIKAGSGLTILPSNGLVLSGAVTLSGLTQKYNNELSLIYIDSTTGTIAADTSKTPTSSTDGSHAHYGSSGAVDGGYETTTYLHAAAGSHAHTVTVNSFSWAVKKRILKVWTDASANFNLAQNMIGLYESLTPPSGWSLCDGSNGTPDMRDYFVYLGDGASAGQASGDNTMGWSYSTDTQGAHSHQSTASASMNWNAHSHTSAGGHTHSGSPTGQTYLPPYYALAFIMFTG